MSWGEAKWIVDNVGSNVGGGFAEFETAGSHTFTVPAGVTIISVTACGGGAGGTYPSNASSSYKYGGAGGGGGAAVVGRKFAVTPGQAIAITVGAGGAVDANGGDTVIGTLLTLGGGKCTVDYGAPGGNAGGDGGGCGGCGGGNPWYKSSSQISNSGLTPAEPGMNGITGCGGNRGPDVSSSDMACGGGGGGSLGNGGNGAGSTVAATNGSRGGGGGGCYYYKSNGGKGGNGYVRIGWGVCMD